MEIEKIDKPQKKDRIESHVIHRGNLLCVSSINHMILRLNYVVFLCMKVICVWLRVLKKII